MEVVLEMPFLSFRNAGVEFAELEKLTWRSYTLAEALPTTSWVKLIDKRDFAKEDLDENSETFVVHVAASELSTGMSIHPSGVPQVLDDPILATL